MNKLFALIFCCLYACPAMGTDFAYSREWLTVGHYRKGFFGYTSSIDSKDFFVAENGNKNPKKELEATIDLFEKGEDIEQICRLPARHIILKNNKLTSKDYPKCEEFEKFKSELQASGVTVLFTDAYMNNPSSLFGHTLIRVDAERKGSQLLAHGANYGAFSAGEDGVLFAFYGLTGVYDAGWTIKPYYDIINTYNNIENRDIWELELNLTDAQKELFVAHLWEMGQTSTKYYFFTKNCSYMIMEALDVVDTSLGLADKFSLQVIPLDTFKAVARADGLLKKLNYRPSRRSKVAYLIKQMNKDEKNALKEMLKKQNYSMDGLTDSQKAKVLEAGYQYIQYQYVEDKMEISEYRKASFATLKARVGLPKNIKSTELKEGQSPLSSHEPMRGTVGFGVSNGRDFQEISYRPAYHSLTDSDYGLLKGAEINFLNAKIRHYSAANKTVVSRFDVVEIKSLSPADAFFMPTSFDIGLNIERETNPVTQKEGYVANGRAKGGLTWAVCDNLWLYWLTGVYGGYGGFLPQNQYLGAGTSVGGYIDFASLKLLVEVEKVFSTSWYGDKIKYKIEAAVPLSTDWALAAEYRFDKNRKGQDFDEYIASVRFFF